VRDWWVGAAVLAALAAAPARADGPRFEATVTSESITLDQNVELTIALERAGAQSFEGYRPPATPDFDVLHTATSEQTQWQTVSGQQVVRLLESHVYVLRPKKKGALTIGPATARLAGIELHTKTITIQVAPVPKNARSTVAPPGLPEATSPPELLRGDEDLYVDAQLDKPKVYVGQQVTATWRMYTQAEILKYRSTAEPKHEDFWSEDLFVPTGHLGWDRQMVKGREYAVALLLKKALFPLKAGRLAITPLDAEATTLQTAFYAGGSGVRRSPALSVEVLKLPSAGRPLDFSPQNVGHYELASEVDRAKVKAGEAVTWKLTLRGTGNVRNVRLAKPEHLDDYKVYEPTVKENIDKGDVVRGEKIYSYLLMPQKGGALKLPEVTFSYFDPEAAKYEIARTAAIPITVEGDPTKMDKAAPVQTRENVLSAQVRPIRNRGAVRSRVGVRLFADARVAAVLLATPPGIWLSVLLVDSLRRRLAKETARTRRRRARRGARRRMRIAEYHIKAQRPPAFFGECARVIYEHLEYRLGAKVEALTLSELRAHLEAHGFSKEIAEGVVKELENCDFARFAPSASGPGEMRAALRRVRTLLEWIEQAKIDEKEAA
jgi:hypothetical protein